MPVIVSVVRDFKLYENMVMGNPCCAGAKFVVFDNNVENLPIPRRYNSFLDSYDYSDEGWLVFCHEDFEFLEAIEPLLCNLDKASLYGAVGGRRNGIAGFGVQVIYGNMIEKNRNEDGDAWATGRSINRPVEVEAFDCCCLIAHSSLFKRFNLRFDEQLLFDFYVEDFCAAAKINYGIKSFVYPMKSCHHSGSEPTDRFYRHLPYLAEKYPHNFFVGTMAYFGTPTWQKRLQDVLVKCFFRK